jgi:hypothetical protein
MKVSSLNVTSYGNGSLVLIGADDTCINISFTEEERNELFTLGLRIFERRQQAIAKSIADMKPAALPSPDVVEAIYEDVNDDIPF